MTGGWDGGEGKGGDDIHCRRLKMFSEPTVANVAADQRSFMLRVSKTIVKATHFMA